MEKIHLPATSNTPEVDFDFQARRLMLRGESYPESAAAFYGDILESTREFLAGLVEQDVIVEVQLTYFNSSSTKMLFGLFEMLNQAAQAENRVHLHWYYDSEDETILEFGLELREDFPDIEFLPRELEV